MRASFIDLLHPAPGRPIVGAFTCYDLEGAAGVLDAVEEAGTGVIILISSAALAAPGGERLLTGLVALADAARAPACVQLDHAGELRLIERALELGVGAVMADGSKLPFGENAAFSRKAVEIAARNGAAVEVELGGLSGNEDIAAAVAAGKLTDPDEAEQFVRIAGAACLAVSIGNVHGHYRGPPWIDWGRLAEIRRRVSIPLSLHGASGLPDRDLRRAIEMGIRKINFNTELREAYLQATERALPEARKGSRLLELHRAQREAVGKAASVRLAVIGSAKDMGAVTTPDCGGVERSSARAPWLRGL